MVGLRSAGWFGGFLSPKIYAGQRFCDMIQIRSIKKPYWAEWRGAEGAFLGLRARHPKRFDHLEKQIIYGIA
jgi:hypothetical protein